jgi:hypothetical protein
MRQAHAGAALLITLLLLTLSGCASTDSLYPTLLKQEGIEVDTSISQLETAAYNGGGAWSEASYFTGPWGVYQYPAVAEAVLADVPATVNPETDRAHEAQVAEQTIGAGIAYHNPSGGDFDPSGSSVVDGTWFAEDLGFVGDVLYAGGWLDSGTLQSWERRLVSYVRWLESSGNASFYVNGNVNLRFALIMLAARNLATDGGDAADAAEMGADLTAEQAFSLNPCAKRACNPQSGAWGWHQNGFAGYLSETPGAWPGNFWCYGPQPCTGFDPEYTALQLQDALAGYVLSGYNGWWQHIVGSEYEQLAPLVSHGELNQADGSRRNDPPFLFVPPVYAVLDEHNVVSDDADWLAQLSEYQADAKTWVANAGAQGPTEYSALAAPAIAVFDAEVAH